jgi:Protein of unknown function (DUF4231)
MVDRPRTDRVMERLDDQIDWYARSTRRNRLGHWICRLASLTMAAAVPITAAFQDATLVPALLGAGIVVAEGSHELFRFQQNWAQFAATAEGLKREKYLFLAQGGPYRRSKDREALLAERVEALVSSETSLWVAAQYDDEERN